MAEVEDDKEITAQGSEEHLVEISTNESEKQDVPNEEEAGDLTINEETFEKNEATVKTMLMEMPQEEGNIAEVTVEEQVTEGNEDAQIAGKEGLDFETKNENEESEQNISMETAKDVEESLLDAVDTSDVELKAEQSDQNPYAEELANENKNKSVEDLESEDKGCEEEIEEVTEMKDIELSAALEGTIGESVQESEDSQAQHVVEEERTESSVNREEIQTGSEDTLVDIVAEPDLKEDLDDTNETPVSVNNGDKPDESGTDAECMTEQMELSAHLVIDNGSMIAITIASCNKGKSSEDETLLKGTEGVAVARMCHDQEPPADVETGPEAPTETPETGLQTSVENVETDLKIQPKGVEDDQATSAKGSEHSLDIPPVHGLPCLGNVTGCLDFLEENQDIYLGPLTERTTEVRVSMGDSPTEKLATEDVDDQPTTNDAELCQDVQVTETMESTEEQKPNQDNLTESVEAMGSPTTVLGESAEVSNTDVEQLCEAEIAGSEAQELTAPGDDQIIVAGEQ
ncbi:aspartic and glutamic acid-rich protein-like [Heptranchias perlo]|uniref:aspartic and glutamic acid-rich protein-like n=1 Tax=Heptranchias perlo TaxID=212740 RepID=UPI0035595D47